MKNEGFVGFFKTWYENMKHIRQNLWSIYTKLDNILSSQINKAKSIGCKDIKGDFVFMSYDKDNHRIHLMSKKDNYRPYPENQLDPSIPTYNWALNTKSSFIFVPYDEQVLKCNYKSFSYTHISPSYVEAINKSYIAILSGKDDVRYWDKYTHRLRKEIKHSELISNG